MLGFCMCTHKPSGTLDVNRALDYCAEQTQRTLTELKTDSGIDYTMMPRNIMADEHHWNCRKATKEEWCAGFWPGVLWYVTNIHRISTFWKKRRSLRTHWSSFLKYRLMTMIWDSRILQLWKRLSLDERSCL